MADASASRLPRTWLPALLISIIVSAFCAAALYVLLAQHDRVLVAQRNASATMAAEYSARATARTLAWFSESLGGENFASVQQTLEQHAQQANLLTAAIITEDNVVVASSNPAAIGTTLQDAAWLAARRTQSGVLAPGIEKGRPAFIVVEPFRRDNRVAGWIRLAVATPPEAAAPRAEDDLGRDVALVITPLLLLMATLLMLTMRGLMSRVRSLLAGIVLDAMEQAPHPRPTSVDSPDRGEMA
ncbi:MAG: hypothetical protein DYH03_16010 [Nitrospira sp. NTP1]|nr:hypothetical protein [Nitrospira sp. NTP1]